MTEALAFADRLEKQLARTIGAVPVLLPILERLDLRGIVRRYCPSGADLDNGTVALVLVLNRLMAPCPLYKVAAWLGKTTLPETLDIEAEKLHDRRLGDLLDALHPHLDCIWKELVHQAIHEFGIRLDFVHYDITSVYFEGDYAESDLHAYGYSRDHRPDTKQVNLRLNITGKTALPLAFNVINGKTSDSTTPVENMKALRALLKGLPGADELTIISDQAMLSREAIGAYDEVGVGFLGPLPTRKEHHAFLMQPSLDELKRHPLAYRPQRQRSDEPASYYGISRPITLTAVRSEER
jgi:transposase